MNVTIINATNDKRQFIDILSDVPEGRGYIWTGSRFIKKLGWRSSRMIDWRHIDHEPACAELVAYAIEMNKAQALYIAAKVALVPLLESITALHEAIEAEPFLYSHPGNGWGL